MLSFNELDKSICNDKIANNYFESLIQTMEPHAQDPAFNRPRSRGVLKQNDPINQYKSDNDVNIVWITGMWSGIVPGTGKYSELLKPLGYNVNIIKTLADLRTAGLGRLVRHLPQFIGNFHQKMAAAHVTKNQNKVLGEVGNNKPDIIIGSSQGGAIALSVANKFADSPMILLCPAWKIFRVQPNYLNQDSSIIHGVNDIEVPFQDSVELAHMFHVPLFKTKDGHIMQQGLAVLVRQLHTLVDKVSNYKHKINAYNKTLEHVDLPEINLWLA